MMYGLDLFSGIGGIGVALSEWVRTVAYCEQDRYAQGVLLSRMQSGDIDRAPIFTDVRELQGKHFATKPDIIFGGFPCQDISVAGNGKGLAGERSGLFYEIIRLAKEIRPSFVFVENVPGIKNKGLEQVVQAFTEVGYDCRWTCLSASSVGAKHHRERWFLLAYSKHNGRAASEIMGGDGEDVQRNTAWSKGSIKSKRGGSSRVLSTDQSLRLQNSWISEPSVGRVVDGVQDRVDRIKCLGNSVVPQQVKEAFKKLMGLKVEL